jgi:hypothetical protein
VGTGPSKGAVAVKEGIQVGHGCLFLAVLVSDVPDELAKLKYALDFRFASRMGEKEGT